MKVLNKSRGKISKRKLRKAVKRGLGFVDKLIDKLPIELHLPSYNYCGPGMFYIAIFINDTINEYIVEIVKHVGTKLNERLARGDTGINGLDELCKEHDIAYATHKNSEERYKADKKLSSGALKRLFSKDAGLGERAASLLAITAMKTKAGLSKFGLGIPNLTPRKKLKKSRKCPKKISFGTLVKDAKRGIKKSKAKTIGSAFKAALRSVKKSKNGKEVKMPRIIKVPNITGGILPLLPVLAGLSTIGSLIGSTASVVRAIKSIKNAQTQLDENKRHNKTMEEKIGNGLYLGTLKKGGGLYLRPHQNLVGDGLYLKRFNSSKNFH